MKTLKSWGSQKAQTNSELTQLRSDLVASQTKVGIETAAVVEWKKKYKGSQGILSYHALPCLVLSYLTLLCFVLSYVILP
jgi:hypothetical protein